MKKIVTKTRHITKACEHSQPSQFKTADTPPIYHGKPLSLDDMQAAIEQMALQQSLLIDPHP